MEWAPELDRRDPDVLVADYHQPTGSLGAPRQGHASLDYAIEEFRHFSLPHSTA
jgi:hypothetical protein